jgi:hypothetical protein
MFKKFSLIFLLLLVVFCSPAFGADLDLRGQTVTLGGDYSYDNIYLDGAIITINSSIDYLTMVAVDRITTNSSTTIDGEGVNTAGNGEWGTGAGSQGQAWNAYGLNNGAGGGGGAGHVTSGAGGGAGTICTAPPASAGGGGGSTGGSSSDATIYYGAKGGNGGTGQTGPGGTGGAGGARISLTAWNISAQSIDLDFSGSNGGGGDGSKSGGGGGGSAGTFFMNATILNYDNGNIVGTGGAGGAGSSVGCQGGAGGAGSDGRFKVYYNSISNSSATVDTGTTFFTSSSAWVVDPIDQNPQFSNNDIQYSDTMNASVLGYAADGSDITITWDVFDGSGAKILDDTASSGCVVNGGQDNKTCTSPNIYIDGADAIGDWYFEYTVTSSSGPSISENMTFHVLGTSRPTALNPDDLFVEYYNGEFIYCGGSVSPYSTINYEIYLDNVSGTTLVQNSTANTYFFNSSAILNDTYYWRCRANIDGATNQSNFTTLRTLYIDQTINSTEDFTTPIVETQTSTFTFNITHTPSGRDHAAFFYYNNTQYTPTRNDYGTYTTLTQEITAPQIPTATNKSFFWEVESNINGTFVSGTNTFVGGYSYFQNTTAQNQTVVPTNFTYCPGGGTVALNFTFWDENTWSNLANETDFEGLFEISVGDDFANPVTKNFSLSNIDAVPFCIGTNDTYFINGEISYRKDGYDARNYYFLEAAISNNTQEIKLYQLNITLATKITYTIQDLSREPLVDKYGYIQRKNLGTGTYTTVAMIKSNSDGQDFAFLRKDDAQAKYRWIIFDESGTIFTSQASSLGTDSYTITILGDTFYDSYNRIASIDRDLTYANSTSQFIATWADATGAVSENCLKVTRNLRGTRTFVCNTCDTSASGTLVCTIDPDEDGLYTASLTTEGSIEYAIDLSIEFGAGLGDYLGAEGSWLGWLLILALGLVGLVFRSISSGLALMGMGLIILKVIGLILLSWIAIIPILVGFGIVIYFVRDKDV